MRRFMCPRLDRSYSVPKEVSRNGAFDGYMPLSSMPRLQHAVRNEAAEVTVEFKFEQGAYGVAQLSGSCSASLEFECQRCLGSCELMVSAVFVLQLAQGDAQMQELPDEVDALVLEGEYLNVTEVIEDELLLQLPLVPAHKNTDCNEYLNRADHTDSPAEQDNPFAVLKSLKTKKS